MDPLPLIPKTVGNQSVSSTLRESFQDTLDGLLYPKDIANNIVRYNADTDIKFKQNACKVVEIHKKLNHKLGEIQDASQSIMFQQGSYEINIDKIENIFDLKERTRLKHCKLFNDLKDHDVERFGLLQKYDLLPNIFKQFLDYRLNENLHLCVNCINEINNNEQEVKRTQGRDKKDMSSRTYEILEDKKHGNIIHPGKAELHAPARQGMKAKGLEPYDDRFLGCIGDPRKVQIHKLGLSEDNKPAFIVEPRRVHFYNCDIGRRYKKSVKLINTSRQTQSLNIGKLPKYSCFSVHVNQNSKIAPGITVQARITYKPDIYRNIQDQVLFRNTGGDFVAVQITVTREPPRLISCIFQPHNNLIARTTPGSSKFLEERRIALNSTIDCGTCLIGEYVFLSMFVENIGRKGKFFIITEDEWYNKNIENTSISLELSHPNMWIYPTFFELNTEEITEIDIIFHPFEPGLHIEKYYVLCDNNSYQQFEILGDALEFNTSMIKIDVFPNDTEIEQKENYCIFFGNIMPKHTEKLTLSVHNTSSLVLDCRWSFQHKPYNAQIFNLDESWVTILNTNSTLAPYSTTDFDFEVSLNTYTSGYYSIFFSFFIVNVPIISFVEDKEFIILEKEEISGNKLTKCADVRIMEIEVACFVDIPKVPAPSVVRSSIHVPSPPPKPKLKFCSPFLEFGILASGLSVQKEIGIRSLSEEPVKWEITEVKYYTEAPPYMEILDKLNFSCNAGEFSCPCDCAEISYITQKEAVSWVSMLLLMSRDEYGNQKIESICIVTYEVIDYDITINTNDTEAPILCPMKLLYTGIPSTWQFSIENHSILTGCFYFLKPCGDDLDKVEITLEPRCGILNPLESKEITATITCKEIGIIENIFIPCFIGAGQELLVLRVLLAVDGIHVVFYLPEGKKNFRKVVWPPRIVYEYDEDWMICPCTLGEEHPEFLDDINYSKNSPSEISTTLSPAPNLNDDGYKLEMGHFTSTANKSSERSFNHPMVIHEGTESTEIELNMSSKSLSSTPTVSSSDINLRNILENEFGDDLYLQEYVVEMHRVPVKTATKFTFYFENTTPIETSYSIEATNFYTDRKFDDTAYKLKQKKIDEIWSDMIINQFGVVVHPDVEGGDIPVVGLIEVNVWVYAKTWGIYMEEIVIDITDVIPFTFSVLFQVVGSPIIIPLALNTITEYPTIRFGKVAYCSSEITRKIKVDNVSSIPVNVVWHSFLKTSDDPETNNKFNSVLDLMDKMYYPDGRRLILTKRYYGSEKSTLFEITPRETVINGNASFFLHVAMKPENFAVKMDSTDVRCFIIGHIYVEEKYRDIDQDFVYVEMEVLATLELPTLTLDFICGETQMHVYANDIIFNKDSIKPVRLLFQNKNSTPAEVEVYIDEPFKIVRVENGKRNKKSYCVKPRGCLEVLISNNLNHQKIIDLSKSLYKFPIPSTSDIATIEGLKLIGVAHTIDRERNMMRIQKDFTIRQRGVSKLIFPIDLYIYFPHIQVKPTSIKFQNVMVGKTSKALVSIYNLTECPVKFEVYKSVRSDVIFVRPHYGEIPKSTGVNKQFVDIFIYFTPSETKQYQESIRVVTNIPNYYIEIPIKGVGTANEKDQVDYKI